MAKGAKSKKTEKQAKAKKNGPNKLKRAQDLVSERLRKVAKTPPVQMEAESTKRRPKRTQQHSRRRIIESEDDHSDSAGTKKQKLKEPSTESDSDAPMSSQDANSENDGSTDKGPSEAKSEVHKRAVIKGGKQQKDPLAAYRKFVGFVCREINPFLS